LFAASVTDREINCKFVEPKPIPKAIPCPCHELKSRFSVTNLQPMLIDMVQSADWTATEFERIPCFAVQMHRLIQRIGEHPEQTAGEVSNSDSKKYEEQIARFKI